MFGTVARALGDFDKGQQENAQLRANQLERELAAAGPKRIERLVTEMASQNADSMAAKSRAAAERMAAARVGEGPIEEIEHLLQVYPSLGAEDQLKVRRYLAEQQGPGVAERLLGMRLGMNQALADRGMKGALSRGSAYAGATAGSVAGAAALMEAMEALQPGSTEGLEA